MAWFPDDGACLRHLERLRGGEGFVCRFCGSVGGGWWQMGDGLRRCAERRSETSVTAGTIFAGTRTPLVSWFAAVWYVVHQMQGVSALGLQRVLGLGSYQTAWAWLHKLRVRWCSPPASCSAGLWRVDECYIGTRRQGSGGRGAVGNAIVVIAVEERGQGPGRVRLRRVPNVTNDTLTEFVLDHVARHSEVRTVGWQGYFDIGKYRFRHVVTNVSASGDPAHVVLPHVHLVASLVKRWILGRTRERSVTTSSTTTWTSSRCASTDVTPATVACSSTDSCRALWPLIPPLSHAYQRNRRIASSRVESGSEVDSQLA